MSPISSKKRVPLSEASNRPSLLESAPVNAPFSCPNNSDSSNSEGMAEQFTLIKLPDLSEKSWIAFATTSLPHPVSPLNKTVEFDLATILTNFFS